ncbi:MAG TPA: O-antigen ligase family protein [Verrucomicrobiota bacterium]|nr:O-antigen ligase family protein [Verrucomicrobiota bacterium]
MNTPDTGNNWRRFPAWSVWGRGLVLVFALVFPFCTGPSEYDSNLVKYWGLMVFAGVAAILLLGQFKSDNECGGMAALWKPALIAVCIGIYMTLCAGVRLDTVVTAVILAAVGAVCVGRRQSAAPLPRRTLLPLILLFIVFLICSLASSDQYTALFGQNYRKTGFVTFSSCMMVLVATVYFLKRREDVRLCLRLLLAASPIICVIGLAQYFGVNFPAGPSVEAPDLLRSFGTMGQANWFGTYLMLLLPFAVTEFLQGRRIFGALASCLIYANVLTSLTRGVWLTAILFLIVALMTLKRERGKLFQLVGLFVVVTAMLSPWDDWRLFRRAATLQQEVTAAADGSPGTGSGRFAFWKYGLSKLPQHALIGAGPDNYASIASPNDKAPNTKAHSIYVEYALTLGLPGLACYLWLLLKSFSKLGGELNAWAFRCSLMAYLVQGITLHDTIHAWPLVWLIAGLALVWSRESPDKQRGL